MLKRILAAFLVLILLVPCTLAEEESILPEAAGTSAANEPTSVSAEQLVYFLAQQLKRQDYTLEIQTEYDSKTLRAGSSDGETIRVEVSGTGMVKPVEIQIDAEKITVSDEWESYAYSELPDLLLNGITKGDAREQLVSLAGLFDEYDLKFLEKVGEQACYELLKAGAIPTVKYVNGETCFTLSITPDLIVTAAVRLIERILNEHRIEIDSLLARAEPVLRKLVPDMFEEYDSEAETYVQRGGYTCAELQAMFEAWMAGAWLRYGAEFDGMHLDIGGRFGNDGWQVDAEFFMPDSDIACWFKLSGDDDGHFEGAVEYFAEGYSRVTERYEPQVYRFNISGEAEYGRFSMCMRPESPIIDFTGLKINYMADSSGWVVDAVTDVLDFRMEVSDQFADISAVLEDVLAEVHLSWFGGVPQGSLIYQAYRDGIYVKLNEAK